MASESNVVGATSVAGRFVPTRRVRRLMPLLSLWLGVAFVATLVSPLVALLAHGLKGAWLFFLLAAATRLMANRKLRTLLLREVQARIFELTIFGLWLMLILGNMILGRGYAGAYQLMQVITASMVIVVALLYSAAGEGSDRMLWTAIILVFGLEAARSLPTMLAEPMLPRLTMLPRSDQATVAMRAALASVGEYGYYTSLAIMLPYALGFALDSRGLRRALLLPAAGILALAIGLASFMGAILLIPAGFALLVFFSVLYRRLPVKILIALLILGILAMVLWFGVLVHTPQGVLVQNKLDTQVASFQEYGFVQGDLTGRAGLFLMSVETFLAHPLFGIGPISGTDNPDLNVAVGGHSSWIDIPAEYGLLGATLYFCFLLAVTLRILRAVRRTPGIAPVGRLVTWSLFGIYGFANPVVFQTQIYTVVFLVVMSGAGRLARHAVRQEELVQ